MSDFIYRTSHPINKRQTTNKLKENMMSRNNLIEYAISTSNSTLVMQICSTKGILHDQKKSLVNGLLKLTSDFDRGNIKSVESCGILKTSGKNKTNIFS